MATVGAPPGLPPYDTGDAANPTAVLPAVPFASPRGVGAPAPSNQLLQVLLDDPGRHARLASVVDIPERPGLTGDWPRWAPASLVDAFRRGGCSEPWHHQVEAAEAGWRGESVVIATGTASGKSLAFLLPALSALLPPDPAFSAGSTPPSHVPLPPPGKAPRPSANASRARWGLRSADSTVLYVSPTKALAADQLRALDALDLPLHAAVYDGDTPNENRALIRNAAAYVLTNPDMLHLSVLPGHDRWADFLRRLRFVVLDECHTYRGVFGSHVSAVLRRLRRVCAHYGSDPAFLLASATAAEPAAAASRLTGLPVRAVTTDTSRRGSRTFALWEPPLLGGAVVDAPGAAKTGAGAGGRGRLADEQRAAPSTLPRPMPAGRIAGPTGARRTATAEVGDLLADLAGHGARTLAFVRSRKGAELVAAQARRILDDLGGVSQARSSTVPQAGHRIAAYRGGYLPEERRVLERDLRSGHLLGLATTNALELGIDVVGLDAVLLAGWPGSRASLWQQAGRAGRAGQDSLVVFVARDDPLDTYLLHHPDTLFGQPVEATVFDPSNPYVLAPHLCAAAAELPLQDSDLALFGPAAAGVVRTLVDRGALRRRQSGWHWPRRERAASLADLRGSGGAPVRIAERSTGRLLGTVDASAAPGAVHAGAVYVHQGESYLVDELDLEGSVAFVTLADPDYFTTARSRTVIRVLQREATTSWGQAEIALGLVEVTSQVVAFLRISRTTGDVLGEEPLDLPARDLRTRATWWTVPDDQLAEAGIAPADVPGAAHAAEHASIGLLPLFATCDRWDIGGVSTARHDDTDRMTVFVYDGAAGGAGFAERGYASMRSWLRATADAVAGCSCADGCPACVQSPKCGSGNEPLRKQAAVRLLGSLLAGAPEAPPVKPKR